jgi:hypothetical protein
MKTEFCEKILTSNGLLAGKGSQLNATVSKKSQFSDSH